MSTHPIEHEVLIEAPIEVVWRTVTEPDQITQWFTDEAELDLRPGGDGALTWDAETANADAPVTAPLMVEAVEPPTRLAFRWSHPAGEVPVEGNSMLVEFTLAAEGPERTRLRVTETGLEATGWSEEDKEHYAVDHRDGWSRHLCELESFLGGQRTEAG